MAKNSTIRITITRKTKDSYIADLAGKTVRAVMTAAGVQNVLTKSLGSANPHNVVKATFDALSQLRDRAEVAALRGKTVEEL